MESTCVSHCIQQKQGKQPAKEESSSDDSSDESEGEKPTKTPTGSKANGKVKYCSAIYDAQTHQRFFSLKHSPQATSPASPQVKMKNRLQRPLPKSLLYLRQSPHPNRIRSHQSLIPSPKTRMRRQSKPLHLRRPRSLLRSRAKHHHHRHPPLRSRLQRMRNQKLVR